MSVPFLRIPHSQARARQTRQSHFYHLDTDQFPRQPVHSVREFMRNSKSSADRIPARVNSSLDKVISGKIIFLCRCGIFMGDSVSWDPLGTRWIFISFRFIRIMISIGLIQPPLPGLVFCDLMIREQCGKQIHRLGAHYPNFSDSKVFSKELRYFGAAVVSSRLLRKVTGHC